MLSDNLRTRAIHGREDQIDNGLVEQKQRCRTKTQLWNNYGGSHSSTP